MKKKILIILVVIGVIQLVLWSFNILRFYNYPTAANEPNLKENSRFVWSSLVEPRRLDFVCYTVKTDTANYEVAMRLVGMPNDVIEIKKGKLFVNNEYIDEKLNLRRQYILGRNYFDTKIREDINENQQYYYHEKDSVLVYIDDSVIADKNLKIKPKILDKNEIDKTIFSRFKKNWNNDNFGPIRIPDKKFFVMGDNRSFSFDSRYNGFIGEEDILGTIIHIW